MVKKFYLLLVLCLLASCGEIASTVEPGEPEKPSVKGNRFPTEMLYGHWVCDSLRTDRYNPDPDGVLENTKFYKKDINYDKKDINYVKFMTLSFMYVRILYPDGSYQYYGYSSDPNVGMHPEEIFPVDESWWTYENNRLNFMGYNFITGDLECVSSWEVVDLTDNTMTVKNSYHGIGCGPDYNPTYVDTAFLSKSEE